MTLAVPRAKLSPMRSLHVVLATPPDQEPLASIDAWWQRHRTAGPLLLGKPTGEILPIDQAIVGGFLADRVGYAFASGYQAALRALVPDLPPDRIASLCMTERGGGHPRAVETRLDEAGPGAYRLTGRKRWSTLSTEAGVLLVVASTGSDERGRNRLRLVRVESAAPGVTLHAMPAPPFTAEISHAEARYSLHDGAALEITHYGQAITVDPAEPASCPIPEIAAGETPTQPPGRRPLASGR